LYGGTERVVATLCDALVARGHDVTLFATADSDTRARLYAPIAAPLRMAPAEQQIAAHVVELGLVADRAAEFDVIHFHVDYLGFPLSRFLPPPSLHTLHGRLDLPHMQPVYAQYRALPLVSISDAQRAPLRSLDVRGLATVYHGLRLDDYPVGSGAGGYLAFLGRISPEKRPDLAIAIAKRVGIPLKIAAKVDPTNVGYFESTIRPLLDDPLIEFLGEIGGAERVRFLGDALALVFPIEWPEPFGLVMIESMACGTPVVALRYGSVTEVLRDGHTGFVVDDVDDMVDAVRRIDRIDRAACRREVERRFSDMRMAASYEEAYAALLAAARHG
jgi:glycosyltransferase involved in cell wall biosynthesis